MKVRARVRVIAIPSGSGVKVLKSGKIHTGATNMRNTCNSAYPGLQPYVSRAATLCIPGCNPMYPACAAARKSHACSHAAGLARVRG